MNTGLLIFIIIIAILILAATGVLIWYFGFRKKAPTPPGGGESGINNSGESGTNTTQQPGVFSIQSVSNPNLFMTFNDLSATIASSQNTILCNNYKWENPIFSSNQISYLNLKNDATTIQGQSPPFFLNLVPPQTNSEYTSIVSNVADRSNVDSTWGYNSTDKTWCNPNDVCLYLGDDSFVVGLQRTSTNSSDINFQWEIVQPITNCTNS